MDACSQVLVPCVWQRGVDRLYCWVHLECIFMGLKVTQVCSAKLSFRRKLVFSRMWLKWRAMLPNQWGDTTIRSWIRSERNGCSGTQQAPHRRAIGTHSRPCGDDRCWFHCLPWKPILSHYRPTVLCLKASFQRDTKWVNSRSLLVQVHLQPWTLKQHLLGLLVPVIWRRICQWISGHGATRSTNRCYHVTSCDNHGSYFRPTNSVSSQCASTCRCFTWSRGRVRSFGEHRRPAFAFVLGNKHLCILPS